MVGQTLAHYKILEKIGSGGMGEVYLALDTKLDRKVALKVLPPDLAENEERRARFQREAKAIAALDHPNIVQVFSVEEADGTHFITMQLVQGKTLTELLPKNGFPLNKFFDIAIPLADAVAAAHQEGITHRDLKPDNVMVADDGRVKVLDFGLAKPTGGFAVSSEAPTAAKTDEGVIVGTVAYMSPEQAEGKPLDHRTDLFSIGIILYEMATGQRPFRGDTSASTLSSILKDTPRPISEIKPDIPRELTKVIRRCLSKDSGRRFQNAKDLWNELEELKTEWSSGELPTATRTRTSPMNKWLAGAIVALIAVVIYLLRSPRADIFRLVNPVQVTSAIGVENYPSWSPDGSRLAYEFNPRGYTHIGNWDIFVSHLEGEPVNLTQDHTGEDRYPAWSPDGRQIAFYSQRDDTWGLYTMSSLGGSLRKLLSLPNETVGIWHGPPQWSFDGQEVAVVRRSADGNYVEIVSSESLQTRRVELDTHEGNAVYDLSWSPDGHTFAYLEGQFGNTEVTRLWVVSSEGGTPHALTEGYWNQWASSWSADGRQLFYVSNRGGSMDLWQQRMDTQARHIGEPKPLTAGMGMRSASFSPDGRKLAYARGRQVANVWRAPVPERGLVSWDDAEQITFDEAFVEYVDVSPDGNSLAVSSDRAGNQDLWVLPAEGGEMTQLTRDVAPDWHPRWSPDGRELAFYSFRSGNRDIWIVPVDGGPARQLISHPAQDILPAWSPDGGTIAFQSAQSGVPEIWLVASEGGEPRQVTHNGGSHPEWSPDGEWLLYTSTADEFTGLWRVPTSGSEPEHLAEEPVSTVLLEPEGARAYYFTFEDAGAIWALSLADGSRQRVTDLSGRRGKIGANFAVDGRYIYFTWRADVGDIWVMDVVTDED